MTSPGGPFPLAERPSFATGHPATYSTAKVLPEPPQTKEKEQRIAWPTPTLPRIYAGYHTPGAADLEATALQLVAWPLLFVGL